MGIARRQKMTGLRFQLGLGIEEGYGMVRLIWVLGESILE